MKGPRRSPAEPDGTGAGGAHRGQRVRLAGDAVRTRSRARQRTVSCKDGPGGLVPIWCRRARCSRCWTPYPTCWASSSTAGVITASTAARCPRPRRASPRARVLSHDLQGGLGLGQFAFGLLGAGLEGWHSRPAQRNCRRAWDGTAGSDRSGRRCRGPCATHSGARSTAPRDAAAHRVLSGEAMISSRPGAPGGAVPAVPKGLGLAGLSSQCLRRRHRNSSRNGSAGSTPSWIASCEPVIGRAKWKPWPVRSRAR